MMWRWILIDIVLRHNSKSHNSLVKLNQQDEFILEGEEAKEAVKIQVAIVQALTGYEKWRIE